VKRLATLCFDGLLSAGERDTTVRTVRSAGGEVTSWNEAAGRSYASVLLAPHASLASALPKAASLHVPALFVARVIPADASRLDALEAALGGPERPPGILAVVRESSALVLEVDSERTTVPDVLALVDRETAGAQARRIEPLLPVDDAILVRTCAALLGEPDLDTSRLIETYIEPMLSVWP
jgi:hypothetical protein